MNNQNHQNQDKTADKAVVKQRRRFIKGAGIATPIALTLASGPVFGAGTALCLSQQLSGNLSRVITGNCTLGFTTAAWLSPLGTIGGYTTITAWSMDGYAYGTLKPFMAASNCASYKNGTTFNTVFGGADSRPMRQILCDNLAGDQSSGAIAIITAMLNAKFSVATASNYVLTPTQVLGLWNGTIPIPAPYTTLVQFLTSTW